jgi:hypothetical protein
VLKVETANLLCIQKRYARAPAYSDIDLFNQGDGNLGISDVATLTLIASQKLKVDTQLKEVEKARQALRAAKQIYESIQYTLHRLQSSIAPLHRLPYESIGKSLPHAWNPVIHLESWRGSA